MPSTKMLMWRWAMMGQPGLCGRGWLIMAAQTMMSVALTSLRTVPSARPSARNRSSAATARPRAAIDASSVRGGAPCRGSISWVPSSTRSLSQLSTASAPVSPDSSIRLSAAIRML